MRPDRVEQAVAEQDAKRFAREEARFAITASKRGADVRPDFNWNKTPDCAMGFVEGLLIQGKPRFLANF